jgi:PTS system nitrogen regulatory IIA component
MNLLSCFTPERTLAGASASSKKRAFEIIAELLSQDCESLSEQEVLDSLFARERIGCTGIGHGIAIPHGRCSQCDTIRGAILMLEEGVDYDAPDKQPVDVFFALLVPEQASDAHIQCLSAIAKLLKQEGFCRQLRNAYNNQALYDIFKSAVEKTS